MDILAHGLWSYIFFWKTKKPFYAVLFGLSPDIFSWAIYSIYRFFDGNGNGLNHFDASQIPQWVFSLYGITHSLFVAAFIFGVIFLIFKKIPVYMWAWPIAILMDIPTHSREFLPTPFLWPVSDWHFPGFSWGNGTFMTLNYIAIAIFLTIIIAKKKQINKGKRKKS